MIDYLKISKIADKVIKFIEETMKNWRVKLTAGGKKFTGSENPERYLSGTFAVTITIRNSDDSTSSHN